jgi:hypothetical protein
MQGRAFSTRLRRQLQHGTREYDDAQNISATTVYEQPNMTLGPGTNLQRTSKPCGAPIEAALTMFRDLTEQLSVNGWWRGWPLGDEPSGRPTKLEWSITLGRPRGSSLTSEVGGSDSLSTYRIDRFLAD